MDLAQIALIGGLIFIALPVAVLVLVCLFVGFLEIFRFAAEQGFLGIAAFVACWVFLSLIMLVATFAVGAYSIWREPKQISNYRNITRRSDPPRPEMGTPEYYEWANREGRYRNK